jgi:phosphoesterase RecJ-like protein
MAIHTDSGGLKFAPTSGETIRAYAELVDLVPDYHDIIFKFENMKEREELKFQGLVLNSIEEYFNNQVAISAISLDRLIQNKIDPNNAFGQAGKLVSVPDWKIGITMFEKDRNVVAISSRTADSEKFNLSELMQTMGGGGHPAASGANVKMPLAEAKKMVLEKIAELFPDLGKQ